MSHAWHAGARLSGRCVGDVWEIAARCQNVAGKEAGRRRAGRRAGVPECAGGVREGCWPRERGASRRSAYYSMHAREAQATHVQHTARSGVCAAGLGLGCVQWGGVQLREVRLELARPPCCFSIRRM